MSKTRRGRGLYVVVARGIGAGGGAWALSYPRWKWESMTPEEQQQAIAWQRAAMGPAGSGIRDDESRSPAPAPKQ